jgi:hypothetical protein
MDLSGSRYGSVAGFCEQGNELLGPVRDWERLHYLRNYHLLNKKSVPIQFVLF